MGLFDLFKSAKPEPERKRTPVRFNFSSAVGDSIRSILTAAGVTRLESTWTTTATTADSYISRHWTTIVARSREQAENGDHARKYVVMQQDNIIGPNGLVLNSQAKDPDGKPDKLARKVIEEAWEIQGEVGNFDVTGRMSRVDCERLALRTAVVDGEAIAILRYGDEYGPFGFAVQMVDPMLLDPGHFERLPSGNVVKHGIEFNADGKAVAYHFLHQDKRIDDYSAGGYSNRGKHDRIEAKYVVHAFKVEMVGQKRGLPWMRTALGRLRMLSAFEDAALVNARVGAAKMGFFRDSETSAEDEPDDLPMDAEAGVFENIGSKEFVSYNPQFPDPFMGQFSQSLLRSIASGLSVSYNTLASDLTAVNFSSIRQGALDDREHAKADQVWFEKNWTRKIFNAWLEAALLSNKITVAGKPLRLERKSKYMAANFQGRRWGWIDPQAEVQANILAIQNNLKSKSEAIRDGGNDIETVFDEIQAEKAEEAARKIAPPPPPGSPMSGNAVGAKETKNPQA